MSLSTTKIFLALGDAHLVDDSNAKATIDKSHAQLTRFKILRNVFQEDQTLGQQVQHYRAALLYKGQCTRESTTGTVMIDLIHSLVEQVSPSLRTPKCWFSSMKTLKVVSCMPN